MTSIEIDYRDTIKKADHLEALAKELRKVASRDLQELQSGMGRSWRGSAAEMYKKRTTTFSRLIESRAKELEGLAQSLRQSAERYHWLEMTAQNIFGTQG